MARSDAVGNVGGSRNEQKIATSHEELLYWRLWLLVLEDGAALRAQFASLYPDDLSL